MALAVSAEYASRTHLCLKVTGVEEFGKSGGYLLAQVDGLNVVWSQRLDCSPGAKENKIAYLSFGSVVQKLDVGTHTVTVSSSASGTANHVFSVATDPTATVALTKQNKGVKVTVSGLSFPVRTVALAYTTSSDLFPVNTIAGEDIAAPGGEYTFSELDPALYYVINVFSQPYVGKRTLWSSTSKKWLDPVTETDTFFISDKFLVPSVTITHKSTSSTDPAIVEITGSVSHLTFIRQNGNRINLVEGTHYTFSGTTYSFTGGMFWTNTAYDHLEAEFSDGTVISFDPKEEPVAFTASLATKVGASNVGFTATATTDGAGDANVRVRLYTDSARTSFLWETVVSNLTDGGNVSFYLPYSGGAETLAPGTTYYTSLVDNDSGDTLDTGQFTVPHYTTKVFKEWRKDGTKFDFLTPITQDITLVGAWDEVYRVTFADYDGTVLKTQDVVDGSDQGLVMPADPSRDGYTFAGWVCSLDGHIWDASNDEVISEMTLKASYTQN